MSIPQRVGKHSSSSNESGLPSTRFVQGLGAGGVIIKCPRCGHLRQLARPVPAHTRVTCARCAQENDFIVNRDAWIDTLRERTYAKNALVQPCAVACITGNKR